MPNGTPQQQPQPEKPKFSLFKISEWPEFIRNWWIRLPFIERAGFRRRKVGERYPPLLYEIRERWLKINSDMYGVLETIEGTWGDQSHLYGFTPPPPPKVKGNILYNKAGIVQTYVNFGIYSDIERIPSEATWFNVGTDLVEEDVTYEIPPKEEWSKDAWNETAVERLMRNPAKPWKLTKVRSIKLGFGTVYHENKMEFKEVLHCFGFNKVNQLGAMILQYGNLINREFMQRRGVPVELRTNFEQTVTKVQELLGKIYEIEHKNYDMLAKLQSEIQQHTKLWEDLVYKNTPEAKNIIIRFPHTFRIVKTYLLEEITETVKKVDENGEIEEETIKTYHSLYLDPTKNPYKGDLDNVKTDIQRHGGEAILRREADGRLRQANGLIPRINELNENIKRLTSSAIKGNFKKDLITDLANELQRKKFSSYIEFLDQVRTIYQELMQILRFLNLKETILEEEKYFRLNGQLLANLQDLYNALKDMRNDTFRRYKNNFAIWIKDQFKDMKLAKKIADSKTKEEMLEVLEPIVSVTSKQYTNKVNELFTLITEKLKEVNIVIEKLGDLNKRLVERPFEIKEKALILRDLYKKLRDVINEQIATAKTQIDVTLRPVENAVNELADSAEAEFDKKREDTFNLIVEILTKSGIDEETAKRYVQTLNEHLDTAMSNGEITYMQQIKTGLMVERNGFLDSRKEILDLIFRKEKFEFYVKGLPDNPEFEKRPEEIEYGLDENGYPLEIDLKNDPYTGKVGAVLIDRWWSEIAQNPWQLETIALKPGGKEVLEKHLNATVTYYEEEDEVTKEKKLRARVTGAKRSRRYIKDERFWGYVDLLEAGHMIFSYWDSVRDDFRDGRFHLHSKSVADYVIEGMGGFDEERAAPYFKAWGPSRKLGVYFTRRGKIPRGAMPIEVNVADRKMQINANPYWFTNEKPPEGIPGKPKSIANVPSEEEKVKRDYIMRLTKVPEGDLPEYVIKKEDGYYIKGTRKPTKYNPAFDRRAEKMKYLHWGRMYYYEWIGNVNNWSENPFPHMSTRGIALYLAYLAANDAYNYTDGIEVLRGQKMDYGVRGQGMHGEVNPLEGIGILQEN